ncbi:plasmid partitioning protein RepB [Paracoccus sp. (in: a-proteobacteria)]|uniref:plasmid partitioning protein RepB n=1 Tax=Paracoccus sp. TaxID=267 RepID=UPI00396C9B14
MGRKLFGGMPLGIDDDPALEPRKSPDDVESAPPFTGRSRARSAQALAGGILELTANSIRDLDPAVILSDGPADRLGLDPESIAALAESIRTHGQQVPILVRPSGTTERYKIVYGRRRLAAVRTLGPDYRVKAIVRTLDDDAAVLAQGQENNLRVDPSYIEKALFARELRDANYLPEVIQDALGIDRTAVSKMKTIVDNVPLDVIRYIGAAHEIGRTLWTELARYTRDEGLDLVSFIPASGDGAVTGADRFEQIIAKARKASADAALQRNFAALQQSCVTGVTAAEDEPGRPHRLLEIEGRHIGTVKKTGRSVTFSVSLRHQSQFGQWLDENANDVIAELHKRWTEARGSG